MAHEREWLAKSFGIQVGGIKKAPSVRNEIELDAVVP